MAEEKRKPDVEIDNERFCVRAYYGKLTREERQEIVEKATAEYFRKMRPQLIEQGKLDQYSV